MLKYRQLFFIRPHSFCHNYIAKIGIRSETRKLDIRIKMGNPHQRAGRDDYLHYYAKSCIFMIRGQVLSNCRFLSTNPSAINLSSLSWYSSNSSIDIDIYSSIVIIGLFIFLIYTNLNLQVFLLGLYAASVPNQFDC